MLNNKEKTCYKTYYTGSLKITNAIQIHLNKFNLKLNDKIITYFRNETIVYTSG